MSIQILINSIDRADKVDWTSVSIDQQLTKTSDQMVFDIKNYGSKTFVPNLNDEVVATNGGTRVFGGYVVSVTDDINGLAMVKKITCRDYSYALDNILIAKTYTNMSANDIITNLMTFAPAGFTMANVNAPAIITKITFRYISLTECLKKMVSYLVTYDWYVDYNKDIHFFPIGSVLSPYNLTDTSQNYLFGTLNVVNDISQMANFVYIRGGMVKGAYTRTEYFSGDASSLNFALGNNFYSIPTVTVGGVSKTVGIDNVSEDAGYQCQWNQDSQLIRFTAGNTPAAGTNNIVVTSYPRYPLIYQKQTQTSVALYGAKPKLITDKTITDIPTASRRADAELAAYDFPVGSASFTTDIDGLVVGQMINIQSTIRNINQNYKIQEIHTILKTPTELRYEIKCQVAGNITINDVLTLLLITNPTAQEDATANDTIERIVQFLEDVTITDTVTTLTKTSAPYVYGDWLYREKITINHTKVATDQTDYPVYIDLSTMPDHFWANVKSDGSDIRMFNSDGTTEIPYELVAINTTAKTGEFYFKGNLSSSVDTDFYIKYRNVLATAYARTDTYGSNNVWPSGSSIYHMGNYLTGSNKVTNPTFDVDLTGYAAYVNGGASINPTLTRDTSVYYSSPASLKHVGSGASTYSGCYIQPTVTNGASYVIRLKTKGTVGQNFNIYAEVTSNPAKNFTQTGDWIEVYLDFVANSTAPLIYFRTLDDDATFWIDDVTIYASTINDSSSSGYNGTKVGASDSPFEVDGNIGKAQSFDGVSSNGYIDTSNPIDTSLPQTFSAWVFQRTIPDINTNGVIDKFQSNTGVSTKGNILHIINSSGKLAFTVGTMASGGNREQSVQITTAFPLNQWVFVQGVYDGTNILVYQNGIAVSVVCSFIPVNSISTLRIGCTHHSNGTLDGNISEARVYNTALTSQYITTEYNNQSSPATFYTISQSNLNVGRYGLSTWS